MAKQASSKDVKVFLLHRIPAQIKFGKDELILFIKQELGAKIAELEGLPMDARLELVDVGNISLHQNVLCFRAEIKVHTQKALLPDESTIQLDFSILLNLINKKIQLGDPDIQVHFVDKGWKKALLQPLVDKLLKWKDKSIKSIIDQKLNSILLKPSEISTMLPAKVLEDIDHLLADFNYEVHELISVTEDDWLRVNLNISLFSGLKIEDENSSVIHLKLVKEELYKAILAKINEDISKNVEQDVSLLNLEFVDKNTLKARGRVGVMNIQKEFDVISEFVFSSDDQTLRMNVKDIDVDGGFLVRKGFELVEPKIRKMIESKVQLPISELISKVSIPIETPTKLRKYYFQIPELEVEEVLIFEDGGLLVVHFVAREMMLQLGPDGDRNEVS